MVFPHVYLPSIFHGPNLRTAQERAKAPIALQYRGYVPVALVGAAWLLRYLGFSFVWALALYAAAVGIMVWFWSRLSPWTHSLWPPHLQSDVVAENSAWWAPTSVKRDTSKYLKFNDAKLAALYSKQRIPILLFIEEYKVGNVDLKVDMEVALRELHNWAVITLTWHYLHFIVTGYMADILWHGKGQDHSQVTEHYNTGNDFFGWFLGPRMIYSSGYYQSGKETLEQAQDAKLEMLCRKLDLQPGMKLLDLGCGWGTWAMYTSKRKGTKTSALSIAKEQVAFCKERAERNKIDVEWLLRDYRDMPTERQFDRVTCFEMSEHVGIQNYPKFLKLVHDALADDGVFYLQIAGLRERWQAEDIAWGIFMYKYIFRGADASLPLNWVVSQLECAGFEVSHVETIGVHYADTIKAWYMNWLQNKPKVLRAYGQEMWRIYEFFLGWSAIIPEKGCSTCFQIVAHKNLDDYDRRKFYGRGDRMFPVHDTPPFDL